MTMKRYSWFEIGIALCLLFCAFPSREFAVSLAVGLAGLALLRHFLRAPETPVRVDVPELKQRPPSKSPTVASPALALPNRPGFIQCYNPSTMSFLGEVPVTSPDGVVAAVTLARAAQRQWAETTWPERRRVLRTIAAAVRAHTNDILLLSAIDTGKQRVDAMLGEVMTSLGKIAWLIDNGESVLAPEGRAASLTTLHKACRVEYAPIGVLGVIAPWNYPFYNMYNHITAGLCAGDAVVIKISEYSAWSAAPFVALARRCLAACGHSPELVQLVQGFGETGAALVANADKIIFTGSPAIGRLVARTAAATLTPCVLELGGKDAAILCEDADVAAALPMVLRGVFQNSGQNCVGIERVLVYESIYDRVVAACVEGARAIRVGPPVDPATGTWAAPCFDMGCVTTQPQLAVIQALVDNAVAQGATLHVGGRPAAAAGAAGALFFPPTVLSGVTPAMRIAREEVFGPVLSIMRVPGDSDAAAAELANATPFGLGATVWSADSARAHRLATRLRSGMVGVNAFGLGYISQDLPFGGVGASGYGRFGGPEGLRACCLERSVVVDWASAWPWPLPALAARLAVPTHVPPAMQYPTTAAAMAFAEALADLQFAPSLAGKLSAVVRLATGK